MKHYLLQFLHCHLAIAFLLMCGCSGNSSQTEEEKNKTTDSAGAAVETPGQEVISLPVYAQWIREAEPGKTFDGLFDSTSKSIMLCENKKVCPVETNDQVLIKENEICYHQGTAYRSVSISYGGKAIFLDVLYVDTLGKNFIGLSDTKDTVVISADKMNATVFTKLKQDYIKTTPVKLEPQIIQHYYKPEVMQQNEKKKEMIMKMHQIHPAKN